MNPIEYLYENNNDRWCYADGHTSPPTPIKHLTVTAKEIQKITISQMQKIDMSQKRDSYYIT